MVRVRNVCMEPQHSGLACPNPAPTTVDSKLCNIVQDGYYTWGGWGTCSATCGGGTRSRTQNVCVPPINSGAPCTTPAPTNQDSGTCGTQNCPSNKIEDVSTCCISYSFSFIVNGTYTWGTWGPCSETCGPGTRTRIEDVCIPHQYGGIPCSTPAPTTEDTEACQLVNCPSKYKIMNCDFATFTLTSKSQKDALDI